MWLSVLALLITAQDSELVVDERFRVEYVVLDVLALDKRGDVVTDLTIDDFVVKEGRQEVQTKLLDKLDFRVASADRFEAGEVSQLAVPRRTPQVIMAFDLESAKPITWKKTFAQARSFLKLLEQRQEILIDLYSLETGSITKGFTKSPRYAIEELDRYELRFFDSRTGGRGQGSMTSGSYGMLMPGVNDFADLERAFAQCRDLFQAQDAPQCIQKTLAEFMENHEIQAQRMIGELESLTYHFQDTDGLKIILLVSPGFALDPPRAAQELARMYLQPSSGARTGSAGVLSHFYSLDDEFQKVIHACIRNRVIFNTFDIFNVNSAERRAHSPEFSGMASSDLIFMFRQYENNIAYGLQQLASDSGGSFYRVADYSKLMSDTLDKNGFFYVLGYDSPEGKPGKFRRIKIKCKRKGVELSYRRGYVGAQ